MLDEVVALLGYATGHSVRDANAGLRILLKQTPTNPLYPVLFALEVVLYLLALSKLSVLRYDLSMADNVYNVDFDNHAGMSL